MKDSLRSVPARNVLRNFVAIGASALLFPAIAHAATIEMTGNNPSGTGAGSNGFTNTGGWPVGFAPSVYVDAATTDYTTGAFQIRSQQEASNLGYTATFLGKSLTIASGGSFLNKGGNGTVLNIADFRIDGGSWITAPNGNAIGETTLNGALTLGSGGATFSGDAGNSQRISRFNMNISGTGPISIINANPANAGGRTVDLNNRVIFAGTNTYTGNTTIGYADPTARWARLDVEAGSSIGDINSSSTVTVLATGLVNFSSINNMGSGQTLLLDSNLGSDPALLQHIGLNYTGEMVIGALSFDGGTTFAAEGTYGAIGSGALFESDFFTGTGLITVVPEPSTAALVMCGIAAGGFLLRRRRSS